jgi:hypothetical protein
LDELHHHGSAGERLSEPVNADQSRTLNFNNNDIYASPATKPLDDLKNSAENFVTHSEEALKSLGKNLSNFADEIATKLKTIGDCAHGPRLALERAGLSLSPAFATDQGKAIRDSGMFDEIPRAEVRPGDYGVRDWSPSVVHRHNGVNKGDSFIVTKVEPNGQLYGANDHHFKVPEDGGRYRNLKFYRLNENFLRLYNAFGQPFV